jgi:hypothetical protein
MSEQDGLDMNALRSAMQQNVVEAEKSIALMQYWKQWGLTWRREPEIDTERQEYLDKLRTIKSNAWQGIFPFKGIRLSRADIEWLLATHENERGPINWSDESQRKRIGLDLRGADLRGASLSELPLAGLLGGQGIDISFEAGVLLQGTNLYQTHLEGADLSSAFFDSETKLGDIHLNDEKYGTVSFADIHWGDVNVAVIDWTKISKLGDELRARQLLRQARISGYERGLSIAAVRAYRQLATVLRNQGLNEDAARFAYRAQLMQRVVFRLQKKREQYLGSLFLDLLAGFGYKPIRSFIAYLIVITVFATAYFIIGRTAGPALPPLGSFVFSMTSFHGRGFFPGGIKLDDPLTVVAALEALVGLLIEVTFIATLTRRLFGG